MKAFEQPALSIAGMAAALKKLEPADDLSIWQIRYFDRRGCLRPTRVNGVRFYSGVDVAIVRTALKLSTHFWSALGIFAALLYLADDLRREFATGRSAKWLVIQNAEAEARPGQGVRFRPGRVDIATASEAARYPASRKLALVSILHGVETAVNVAEAAQRASEWRPLKTYQDAARKQVA
jgi:hypothetical protein